MRSFPGISVLVPVSDIHEAVAFYSEVLGMDAEGVTDDFATLRAGDAFLWLHREDDGIQLAGVELWIGVENVDTTHGRFLHVGLDDVRPPRDVPAWGLRVTSAPDPDGRRVYCFMAIRHAEPPT